MASTAPRGYRFGRTASRLVRGALLVLWILALTFVCLTALNGDLTDYLYLRSNHFHNKAASTRVAARIADTPAGVANKSCPSSSDLLIDYAGAADDDPPPVEVTLDALAPQWQKHVDELKECDEKQRKNLQSAYARQFGRVAQRLLYFAQNPSIDVKQATLNAELINNQLIASPAANDEVKLPLEAQDWVLRKRANLQKEAQARALLRVFLVLSALGAFGALIFLIRDYITGDVEHNLSHYVFRPILGIFLAIAVFVADILVHSVVSSASILEIRYEPLYILALAAGLLTDRAYDIVRGRADEALDRYERKENPLKPGEPPPTE